MIVGVPPQPTLSVIVPAFNERSRLPLTLKRSMEYLKTRGDFEIIVVDDGSSDGTALWVAKEHADDPSIRVLRSASNRGKGAACAAGCLYARGQRVLLMDADGGTPISALATLEEAMSRTGCGVVVGCREQHRPWYRRLMGEVFRRLASTCVSGVSDTQCGFKLLTRPAAAATMPHLRVKRWAYDVELLFLAQALGVGVASARVPAVDRPGSKIRWYTPAQMLFDVVRASPLHCVRLVRVCARAHGVADELPTSPESQVRVSLLYRMGVWSLPLATPPLPPLPPPKAPLIEPGLPTVSGAGEASDNYEEL